MIVQREKIQRVFRTLSACLLSLCLLSVAPASGAAADYTTGTPGGAGKIFIDPETGERRVEVAAPSPDGRGPQQTPIYVYPQVGGPGPYPAPHPPGAKPARPSGKR